MRMRKVAWVILAAVGLVLAVVPVSRAQIACTESVFDDVNAATVGDGFCGYIEQFASLGITGGCSTTPPLYCPSNYVTRAQMAVFLSATLEKVPEINTPLPIGAVVDWWRPDDSWPVPSGFAICNGGIINDSASPLYGKTLPNLTGMFIMGVTDAGSIGTTGGSNNHGHTVDTGHDHGSVSTTSDGSHTHSIDVPAFSSAAASTLAGGHNHSWVVFRGSTKEILSYESDGTLVNTMMNWGDGLDNEGSGIFPIAIDYFGFTWDWARYTSRTSDHAHQTSISHDHPAFNSGTFASHTHSLDLPSTGTQNKGTGSSSNLPSYFGLLKIMRIK